MLNFRDTAGCCYNKLIIKHQTQSSLLITLPWQYNSLILYYQLCQLLYHGQQGVCYLGTLKAADYSLSELKNPIRFINTLVPLGYLSRDLLIIVFG